MRGLMNFFALSLLLLSGMCFAALPVDEPYSDGSPGRTGYYVNMLVTVDKVIDRTDTGEYGAIKKAPEPTVFKMSFYYNLDRDRIIPRYMVGGVSYASNPNNSTSSKFYTRLICTNGLRTNHWYKGNMRGSHTPGNQKMKFQWGYRTTITLNGLATADALKQQLDAGAVVTGKYEGVGHKVVSDAAPVSIEGDVVVTSVTTVPECPSFFGEPVTY